MRSLRTELAVKPYYSDARVRLLHGDCRGVLAAMREASSIDACVTDPPYELGFMGKAWDASGIAYDVAMWREVLRVLKPGAHLLAFGGTRTYHRMAAAIEDAGFEIRDSLMWVYGQGFPKSLNLGDGLGTALKPAHEPIVMARKPFKGTVAANVAAHGTGALNVDACRVEGHGYTQDEWNKKGLARTTGNTFGVHRPSVTDLPDGRWPANVLLDDLAAMVLDEQSGELIDGVAVNRNREPGTRSSWYGTRVSQTGPDVGYGGSGGASRFFYVAKPSREERELGCEGLTTRQRDDSRKDGHVGGDNPRNRGLQRRGNHHPTVKPIELMRWLVRLVTPVGGTVLDPFMGSGTTGCAAVYEQRQFIGIEREADYIEIARRRIAAVAPLFTEAVDAVDPQADSTGKPTKRGSSSSSLF